MGSCCLSLNRAFVIWHEHGLSHLKSQETARPLVFCRSPMDSIVKRHHSDMPFGNSVTTILATATTSSKCLLRLRVQTAECTQQSFHGYKVSVLHNDNASPVIGGNGVFMSLQCHDDGISPMIFA